MIAASVMTKNAKTLRPSNTLLDALEILKDLQIGQLPIVDSENKVLGVITSRGILKSLLPSYISSGELKDVKFAPELEQFTDKVKESKNTLVKDILRKEYTKVAPESSTMEIAALFVNTETHLEAILVTDDEDRLLGVISPVDIYKSLWEQAEQTKTD